MKSEKENSMFGRLSEAKMKSFEGGEVGQLFTEWDELKLDGFIVNFTGESKYAEWANVNSENLCIVKEGSGIILFNGKNYTINEKHAFKVQPNQQIIIKPLGKNLKIISIQRSSSVNEARENGIDTTKIEIVDTDRLTSKVYEFETLAKEVFTPKYKNGLGLIKFIFVNPIPIHLHPHSGRLILPISGKGVTYMEPNLYEAHEDTFALFAKGVIHTNGPIAGNTIELYAVQLPWIESGIDHKDIAGSPNFVKYLGVTPPEQLWKKKEEMEILIKKLSGSLEK